MSDPKAVGCYLDIADEKREFERKVRTVLRGITVFLKHLEFLNVFKYGMFAYQFFCHKLLRWLVPFFLIGALASNVLLVASSSLFSILLMGQAAILRSCSIWLEYLAHRKFFSKSRCFFLLLMLLLLSHGGSTLPVNELSCGRLPNDDSRLAQMLLLHRVSFQGLPT